MKVFIIILHFGDSKVTELCLKSIIEHKKGYEEIVVVDNSKNFKSRQIRLITNRVNLGYAGGMNIGIKYALFKNADYILLLNNDVILEKEITSKLVKFLSTKENVGIVAPAIGFLRKGVKIYDLGGKVNMFLGRTSHYEVKKNINNSPRLVDYVSGCCMLIKKEVFEKIGLFDERFFLYYEDVDFCLRARKAGFKTYVLPSVLIWHGLSQSIGKNSPEAIYYQTQSALIFGRNFGFTRVFNLISIFLQSLYFFIKNPESGRFAFLSLWHWTISNFVKGKER